MLFDKVVESLIRQLMYAVVGCHGLEVDYEAAAQIRRRWSQWSVSTKVGKGWRLFLNKIRKIRPCRFRHASVKLHAEATLHIYIVVSILNRVSLQNWTENAKLKIS